MSAVVVVTPLIIGGWPVITAAVTAAVASMGFTTVHAANTVEARVSTKNKATIDVDDSLDQVFATLTGRTNAVVVAEEGRPVGVITRSDLLEYLAHQRGNSRG